MMLRDHTDGNVMLPGLEASDKAEVVRALVDALSAGGHVDDSAALVRDVMDREAAGDTEVGMGVLIPHVRTPLVRRASAAVATLSRPLAGEAGPLDIVILLVAPEDDPRALLRLLARVVRGLRRPEAVAALRGARTPVALLESFVQIDHAF